MDSESRNFYGSSNNVKRKDHKEDLAMK